MSDYSDSLFDYKENEQNYNKVIREAYRNISIRQAYTPFMMIMGDERAQNSRKLSLKLMKEFSSVYSKNMSEASTHQIARITEKYASHSWMIAQTYNSLIQAFGKDFDNFSYRELASFCDSLAKVGLRQGDIIEESVKKVVGGTPAKSTEEGASTFESHQISLRNVVLPLIESIVQLDLP